MSVIINYKTSSVKKKLSNLILFIDEKFNISSLKKHLSNSEYSFISDLIKTKDLSKKILTFDVNSKRKIIFFFELISKDSIFLLISFVLIKSFTKVCSELEICFFKGEILKSSSTNIIKFDESIFDELFL